MLQLPVSTRRILPGGKDTHWFFGYYDIPAFSQDSVLHLALQAPFMDRLPLPEDKAELYAVHLKHGKRIHLGTTTAWNFQQACMLQWHPTIKDSVIFNVRTPGKGCGYGAVIQSLAGIQQVTLDRPVANVASNGQYAVSINFDRMFDFRPGYGYAGQRDYFYNQPHPAEDGIFLIDLTKGNSRLIVSLARIWEKVGSYFDGSDQKICINHITFNPDGSRIVFLVRNFHAPGTPWRTAILTCDTLGQELFLLSDFAMASHYHWRDPGTVTFYSDGRELGNLGPQLYELNDLTHTGEAIDPGFFVRDGHNSYSPDREYMLYDSYPLSDGCRELYLYDLVTRQGGLLGRYSVAPQAQGDIRCDLHPRWSPCGQMISFDSVHEGFRGIYLMDVAEAKKKLRQ